MLRWGIVYLHGQEIHALLLLKDLIYVVLTQGEIFKELKALTEAVDWLLEMLGD